MNRSTSNTIFLFTLFLLQYFLLAVSFISIPLTYEEYDTYTIQLQLGTPTQPISFLFDTASSLVWAPCGSDYQCLNNAFPHINPETYNPNISSTSHRLHCQNPKCWWVHQTVLPRCRFCTKKRSQTCSEYCPYYDYKYATTSTSGVLYLDSLSVANQINVTEFLVGCSLYSGKIPVGLAGMGRGLESLPSQMGIKRFSYCFRSTSARNNLEKMLSSHPQELSYTEFYKIPKLANASPYFVVVQDILIGEVSIKVANKLPHRDGYGGTFIDTGSSYTFMENKILKAVVLVFERLLGKGTHFRIGHQVDLVCFDVMEKYDSLPKLAYRFQNGAKFELSWWDYLLKVDPNEARNLSCLSILGNHVGNRVPSIIIGTFQQQNVHFEYDLENNKLGFQRRICPNEMVVTMHK